MPPHLLPHCQLMIFLSTAAACFRRSFDRRSSDISIFPLRFFVTAIGHTQSQSHTLYANIIADTERECRVAKRAQWKIVGRSLKRVIYSDHQSLCFPSEVWKINSGLIQTLLFSGKCVRSLHWAEIGSRSDEISGAVPLI